MPQAQGVYREIRHTFTELAEMIIQGFEEYDIFDIHGEKFEVFDINHSKISLSNITTAYYEISIRNYFTDYEKIPLYIGATFSDGGNVYYRFYRFWIMFRGIQQARLKNKDITLFQYEDNNHLGAEYMWDTNLYNIKEKQYELFLNVYKADKIVNILEQENPDIDIHPTSSMEKLFKNVETELKKIRKPYYNKEAERHII